MKDYLISFETAKLAKEKGFNERSDRCYNNDGDLLNTKPGMHGRPNNYSDYYAAVSLEDLHKWLREKFKIRIKIDRSSMNIFIGYIWNNSSVPIRNNHKESDYSIVYEKTLIMALKLIK